MGFPSFLLFYVCLFIAISTFPNTKYATFIDNKHTCADTRSAGTSQQFIPNLIH